MQNLWLAKHPTFFLRVIVQTTQRTWSPCVVWGGEISRPTFQRFGSSNKDVLYTHNIPNLLRKHDDRQYKTYRRCIDHLIDVYSGSQRPHLRISAITDFLQDLGDQSNLCNWNQMQTYIYSIYNTNGNMIVIITHQIKKANNEISDCMKSWYKWSKSHHIMVLSISIIIVLYHKLYTL